MISSGRKDVLIVEDVDTMRSLLAQMLGDLPGIRVSGTARNAFEARLELTRRRPALVLLDEILPGESSLDLLQEIDALGVPTLLMTGIEDPQHPIPPAARGRLVKPSWDRLAEDSLRFKNALDQVLGSD